MSSPEEITAAAISTATLEQTRTTVIIPDIGSTVYQFPLDQHLTSSVFSLPNGIVTTVITVTGINLPIPAPTPAPVSGSPITSNGVDSRSSVAATVSRSSGQEEPSTSTSPTVKKEVLSTQRIITSGPIPSGKDTDNDGFIDSYQAKYENGTLIYGQLENSTLLGGDRNNNGRFDYTDPDDDGDGIPNFAEEKGGLSTGAKAGIAVGVVVPLLILAALAGFFFFRRKSKSKWTGGGIERGVSQRVPNAPPLPAYGPLGAAGEESLAGGAGGLVMRDPPKDDGAMSRLFRHINNRLQNHVLNYYVSPDKSIYQGQLGSCTSKVKKSLESHVSRLDHLLMQESSRVYALRAVLAGLILRKITEGSLFTDSRGGPLTVAKSDNPDPYYEARERTVLNLAQVVWADMRCFMVPGKDDETRRKSLEDLVRSVAEFAKEIERHENSSWDLLWASAGSFDPNTMEVETKIPREGSTQPPSVRGTVYPGLRKNSDEGPNIVLEKTKVLMY